MPLNTELLEQEFLTKKTRLGESKIIIGIYLEAEDFEYYRKFKRQEKSQFIRNAIIHFRYLKKSFHKEVNLNISGNCMSAQYLWSDATIMFGVWGDSRLISRMDCATKPGMRSWGTIKYFSLTRGGYGDISMTSLSLVAVITQLYWGIIWTEYIMF